MSKRDRQGVRTATDLERKYNFGQVFSESKNNSSKQADTLNRLNQTLTQFMADTNAAVEALGAKTESSIAEQGIVNEVVGTTVTLTDASNLGLRKLCLYGKTTQEGTPTPSTPMALVPSGASGHIYVYVGVSAEDVTPQSLYVPTLNGLAGIRAAEGNYTDINGVPWVTDEIDLGRGVFIKRIGVIESYNGEEVSLDYMSTTGQLTAGATVHYVLDEALETPLDSDTVELFKELHTNLPNTFIYNGEGVAMCVSYVADTKTYIDNKFAELAATIGSGE